MGTKLINICLQQYKLNRFRMTGCIMKPNWLSDARLIPDEVMSYLRKIAVYAVNEKGYSPEDVINILGLVVPQSI